MSEAKLGKEQDAQHVENRTKVLRNIKRKDTKYRGVCFDKARNKFGARIAIPDKGYVGLGRFDTEEEAARNYDFYAKKIHGKNCFLNFPDYDYTNFVPKRIIEI